MCTYTCFQTSVYICMSMYDWHINVHIFFSIIYIYISSVCSHIQPIGSSLQSSLMEPKTQRMQRQEKRHEKASGPGASRPFSRVFHYKPSIFGGIPHVWNPSSPLGRSDDSFRKRSGSSEVEAVEAGWFISWKLHLLKGPGHGKMEVPSEFFWGLWFRAM